MSGRRTGWHLCQRNSWLPRFAEDTSVWHRLQSCVPSIGPVDARCACIEDPCSLFERIDALSCHAVGPKCDKKLILRARERALNDPHADETKSVSYHLDCLSVVVWIGTRSRTRRESWRVTDLSKSERRTRDHVAPSTSVTNIDRPLSDLPPAALPLRSIAPLPPCVDRRTVRRQDDIKRFVLGIGQSPCRDCFGSSDALGQRRL